MTSYVAAGSEFSVNSTFARTQAHADGAQLTATLHATPDDLVAYIATAEGTQLVAAPTDVTVGGYPAKHVEVVVRADAGCDPGFFYNWKAQTGGSLWVRSQLGDTIDGPTPPDAATKPFQLADLCDTVDEMMQAA